MTSKENVEKLLNLCGIKINGNNPWDIKVHNEKLYSRILSDGSLGLGESYMDGWWDCKALDQFFFKLLSSKLDDKIITPKMVMNVIKARIINLQDFSRSKKVVKEHYDLGNDFYSNMLDKRMQYTCAYWKNAKNLNEAQEAKLDLICKKLGLCAGMRVLDVGCGLGIDGVTFAQHGARITFVDIVESNLIVVRRISKLLGLTDVEFLYMEDIDSVSRLGTGYDVIWCQGSLINAPVDVIHAEAQALLEHLKPDGRWIELAYPKSRWEREGRLPFDRWGEHTDGPGTPWVEWYDLSKLQAVLKPAEFEVVLYFEFHNGDFNWFDLKRSS